MRILQITHRYKPRIGGAENYIYNLREALIDLGHSVDVLTTDYALPCFGKKRSCAYYSKTLFAPMDNPFSLDFIKQIISRNGYDIYHMHGPWFLTTWISSLLVPKNKIIITAHNASAGNWLVRKIAEKLFSLPISSVLKRSSAIVCLSEADKKVIMKKYGISEEKIHIIPNGIPADFASNSIDDEINFFRMNSLKPNSFKILYVGRLQKDKNVLSLISILDHLPQNSELIIAGSSENRRYVNDIVNSIKKKKRRAHLFLDKPSEFIYCLYKYSDLFITLGQLEGIPTTILEAMSYGLPIICYRAGGVAEIFNKEGGIIVDDLKEGTILDAISYYSSLNNRMNAKQYNLKKIKNFEWPRLALLFEKIYTNLCSDI